MKYLPLLFLLPLASLLAQTPSIAFLAAEEGSRVVTKLLTARFDPDGLDLQVQEILSNVDRNPAGNALDAHGPFFAGALYLDHENRIRFEPMTINSPHFVLNDEGVPEARPALPGQVYLRIWDQWNARERAMRPSKTLEKLFSEYRGHRQHASLGHSPSDSRIRKSDPRLEAPSGHQHRNDPLVRIQSRIPSGT